MSETDRASIYARRLRDAGHYVVNYPGSTTPGIPDLLICVEGRFVGIEMKERLGRTTRMQEYHLQKIRDAGGRAVVARTWDEVVAALEP